MDVNADHEAHVGNKWPDENIRSVIPRLACTAPATEYDITEYTSAFSTTCYADSVKQGIDVTLSLSAYFRQNHETKVDACV